MMSTDRNVVVVTGAGSGIGRATALRFAADGARVIAADIDAEAAAHTAGLAGNDSLSYGVDVSDAAAMETFGTWVRANAGVPDILVNNAGIGVSGPLLSTSLQQWQRLIGVNLWGVIHGCRLFAPMMVERGRGGHIVNIASAAGFGALPALPAYGTTKAAVILLSEALRQELRADGIGVSVVCPGLVNTPIVGSTEYVGGSSDVQAKRRDTALRLYRRRNYSPERVAEQIVLAVRRNRGIVPVTTEARLFALGVRWLPGLTRRIVSHATALGI